MNKLIKTYKMYKNGQIVNYNYKNIVREDYWEDFLGRKLEQEEIILLKNTESEKKMNDKIFRIYEIAKDHNLYIPELTNMYGNCLFESFQYHDLCEDIDEFRCGIAFLMIMFKDIKGIFPGFDNKSLENLASDFLIKNEIVFCRKKRRAYKYDFVTMCIDLATNTSWTRINTNLILVFISAILNIQIKILHNSEYVTVIGDNKSDKTIYLGLIDEIHYFPLAQKTYNNEAEKKCPKYCDNLKLFHQWAKSMAILTNKVTYSS